MREYMKPMISIDDGMAEGVYAAGSGSSIVSGPKNIVDWHDKGQATFTLNLSQLNRSQLTITLTFNKDLNSGWGSGASTSLSGKNLTLYWYSAPETADITVEANGDINQLRWTGCSYK